MGKRVSSKCRLDIFEKTSLRIALTVPKILIGGKIVQMWLAIITGWIIGSTLLYYYLLTTAREPNHPECMDCHSLDCQNCPIASSSDNEIKHAA